MDIQTPSAILKTLRTIHWSLVTGLSLFAAVVAYLLLGSMETTLVRTEEIITFIPAILAVSFIPTALFLFNRQLKVLEKKPDLDQKLIGYQAAHIVKMAMLEGVGLFAIVACFVTYTTVNFFVFALVLILMAGSTPTAFKLGDQLGLSRDEVESLGS